ncbi:MAG: isoleucyl-tRNA synthetase [Methylobacteriaceae bacterium]|jgi:isoleucyl-tRNA synthetase|nr:isoleucyl-tRNA synthetase [Methylobacteriaceae bacterium]
MNKPEKAAKNGARDYSATLYLPQTDFPMRAGLPQKEPEILARWQRIGLYEKLREVAAGRARFVLHDGPPYANGNIHIGHALNKILKDLVTRSQQMLGRDSNYVPGWDCHGLPIEWKIEEEYRAKGKNKDEVPINEFRAQCRAFAAHWIDVQREEFKRLGVIGDWAHPYSTMDFFAEAQIAREIMKFAANGLLYRGSKPVMWSVVEKTALAEAEVEYEDYTSDTVWVAFPVRTIRNGALADARRAAEMSGENPQDIDATGEVFDELHAASIVIWTTTPWTLPGNRAIAFSSKIDYGLYRVTEAAPDNWAKPGALYILADRLASDVFKAARVQNFEHVRSIDPHDIETCSHPLAERIPGYEFAVPLLEGDHVTDDAGTGFVHTAPGHGREDFDLWTGQGRALAVLGIDTGIPYTVDADGFYTKQVPGFAGRRVIDDKGKKGDANDAVIAALIEASHLLARGRLKHSYPHSWRSKKPVIFRNTPQWFIAMDRGIGEAGGGDAPTLRSLALDEIARTRWVPESGENRIRGMIENRPDWVVSRQRAWGVPITVFVRKGTSDILVDAAVNARIADAFEKEGADAWYAEGATARFLAPDYEPNDYEKIDDILDVWFDSGSTHAFTLEDPNHFPGLAGLKRVRDGGKDEIMYLEGSDQHRGWFHSSLLESCGTRLRAPFDIVLTHGFTLDEQGRAMSKSLGNGTVPQKVISEAGADILRLWVASVDYSDDQRIGPEILKSVTDNYRKLRNTLRWMLGSLAHFKENEQVAQRERPELERYMLHRLAEVSAGVSEAYREFDYKKVVALITSFMTNDLSAFYFDVRKDTLYCDPPSGIARKSALATIDEVFERVVIWLAPVLAFTCEETWLSRYPSEDGSVHTQVFPQIPADWRDDALAAKWRTIRNVRRVVTGALEIERAAKRIGSSLEAAPIVYVEDAAVRAALDEIDFAEICITSDVDIRPGLGPADAFRLDEVARVAVVPQRAEGRKCARSWKISPLVGTDPEYPDVTPRDAQALRELRATELVRA